MRRFQRKCLVETLLSDEVPLPDCILASAKLPHTLRCPPNEPHFSPHFCSFTPNEQAAKQNILVGEMLFNQVIYQHKKETFCTSTSHRFCVASTLWTNRELIKRAHTNAVDCEAQIWCIFAAARATGFENLDSFIF